MERPLLILIFIFNSCDIVGIGADCRSFDPREATDLLAYLDTYSPDARVLVERYLGFCIDEFDARTVVSSDGETTVHERKVDALEYLYTFIDGNTKADTIAAFGCMIHEVSHLYASHYPGIPDGEGLYIDSSRTIRVHFTSIFPSRDINSNVSETLKTSRYSIYIYPSKENQSTQREGIYGLLDEFNAYYQGTKVTFDLFGYYEQVFIQYNVQGCFYQYAKEVQSMAGAYLEFKFFILKYLIYAEKHEKYKYNKIIKNKAFREAFSEIDLRYSALIEAFKQRMEESPLAERYPVGATALADELNKPAFQRMLSKLSV